MKTTTVNTKGQVAIPVEIRRKYAIRPGTRVIIAEFEGRILMVPLPENPLREGRGSISLGAPVAEIIREVHREEETHERAIRSVRP